MQSILSSRRPRLGWKERWYSIETQPRDAAIGMTKLLSTRDQLTGYLTNITGTTATDLRTVNNTFYIPNPYQVVPPGATAAALTDVPSDAVMCRVSAQLNGFFYHRTMWLRGVRDGWVQFDINNNPIYTPGMLNAVLVWQKQIAPILPAGQPNPNVVFPLYLQVISREVGVNPKIPVTAVNIGAGNPQMIVLSAANTGFQVGQNVKVAKCRGQNLKQLPPGLRGRQWQLERGRSDELARHNWVTVLGSARHPQPPRSGIRPG